MMKRESEAFEGCSRDEGRGWDLARIPEPGKRVSAAGDPVQDETRARSWANVEAFT